MSTEPERWLRLLPRWALVTGLVAVFFLVVFIGFVGVVGSDARLGDRYIELLQAARAPAAYRLQMVLDAVFWALNGGLLLIFGGLLRRRRPILSVLIGSLGVALLLVGVLAGLIRLNATGALAAEFASASADQQAVLLGQFATVDLTMRTLFHTVQLIQGTGLLVVSWAVLSLAGFPRWLSIWVALPGLLRLTEFVIQASGVVLPTNPPPLAIANIAVFLPLLFVMAAVLWRPNPTLVSAVNG